jgi:hypothetical protein
MANEMRVIWKSRDKNGIDMLLAKSTEYWLVLNSGIEEGSTVTNPSFQDLESLHRALTIEIAKKEGNK